MPDELALDPRLSHVAVRMYAVLLARAYEAGRREPSDEVPLPPLTEVAKTFHSTRQTLAKAIAELTATGWLVTRRDGKKGVLYQVVENNLYQIGEVTKTNPLARASNALKEPTDTFASQTCERFDSRTPPTLVKLDGRNLGYDALVQVTQADPDAESGRIVAGLKKIRLLYWRDLPEHVKVAMTREAFERGLADEIRERAQLYEVRYRGEVDLTPTALASNWTRVTTQRAPRYGAAAVAEEMLREGRGK